MNDDKITLIPTFNAPEKNYMSAVAKFSESASTGVCRDYFLLTTMLTPPRSLWRAPEAQTPKGFASAYRQYLQTIDAPRALEALVQFMKSRRVKHLFLVTTKTKRSYEGALVLLDFVKEYGMQVNMNNRRFNMNAIKAGEEAPLPEEDGLLF
jgi:hypothetical protein